jgi:Glycosyltransferase family 25 (LPS biosynthesis protein)
LLFQKSDNDERMMANQIQQESEKGKKEGICQKIVAGAAKQNNTSMRMPGCYIYITKIMGMSILLLSLALNYVLLLGRTGSTTLNNSLFLAPPIDRVLKSSSSEIIAHPLSPLMIAIACDSTSLSTLGPVILDTWAKNLPYDFRFFVGEESKSIPEALLPFTIPLAAPDEYPPRKKVFTMFKYLHDNFDGQYSWYMKIDIDSYVNVSELEKIVEKLLASGSTVGYIGSPGDGRDWEHSQLGLNGPYCMGFGYLMGHETLEKLHKELDWCLASPHSQHSDTEIGNCVYKTSNATCQKMGQFINYYFSYGANGLVTNANVEKNSTVQQVLSSQAIFFGNPLEAVVVHALKKPSDMQILHMQLTRNLRPMIPSPWIQDNNNKTSHIANSLKKKKKGKKPHPAQPAQHQALNFFSQACVNNPLVQLESTGFILPECKPVQHSFINKINISAIPAYAINLAHRKDRYESLAKRFSKMTSLNVMRFEAINGNEIYAKKDLPYVQHPGLPKKQLSPGEQGYRMSMRALFEKGLQDETKFMLILDDDAYPHNDFDRKLNEILNDNRCGSHFFSDQEGGVLQLGGTVFKKELWGLIDDDLACTQTNLVMFPFALILVMRCLDPLLFCTTEMYSMTLSNGLIMNLHSNLIGCLVGLQSRDT